MNFNDYDRNKQKNYLHTSMQIYAGSNQNEQELLLLLKRSVTDSS
jgi:hypothetical protein